MQKLTLKRRIVLIFAISTLLPFLSTAFVSYHAMSSILNSKVESGVKSHLKNVRQSLEETIDNLNHVSQQLAIPGSVGVKLDAYLYTDKPYQRANLYQEIKTELNEIMFTNPKIGLTMYYFADEHRSLFNTADVKSDFSVRHLPLLAEHYKIVNYGPHISNQPYHHEFVLSVMRKVDLSSSKNVFVYIESNLKITKSILHHDQRDEQYYMILDNNGNIAYSEVESIFQQGTGFKEERLKKDRDIYQNYYWFKEVSDQGWSIYSFIPNTKYNEEKNQWFLQMIYLAIFFGIVSLSIALLLWKMVYRPLQSFDSEINAMLESNFQSKVTYTRIPEFDYLLKQFHKMKNQISSLFKVVEQKEKRRADLEVEKLLYQINPHFLMNTLDTANWLAVMNQQNDISHLVTSLNKLLYYNLGKAGQTSTVMEEIETLKQYLAIQKFRYDFEFDLNVNADPLLISMPVPRFILQPLVENAIYHGLSDNGHIQITVNRMNDFIHISVKDNGRGMKKADISLLLHENQVKQQKSGMGIGLNYVKRVLDSHYDERAVLEINSIVGKGTSVILKLPILEVDAYD